MITQRQREALCKIIIHKWVGIIRQLYVNLTNRWGSVITIRGKDVSFDSHIINALYNLPNYTFARDVYNLFFTNDFNDINVNDVDVDVLKYG